MDNVTRGLLIGALSFTAGAATGGVGMYLFSKRYFEEKGALEKQELAAYYDVKYGVVKEASKNEEGSENKGDDKESTEKEEGIQAEYEAISDIYRTKETKEPPTAYTNYFDSGSSDSSSSSKKKSSKRKKKVDVEIVESEVWDENPNNLDSRFLVYYDADGVLQDEESEAIFEDEFDKDEIVKLIESIEVIPGGVVILQSNITKTLYHVTIEAAAYEEAGLDD